MDEAKTEEQPDGNMQMAWKGLMDMFELLTLSTRLALKKEFQYSKSTSVDVYPDVWMTELEAFEDALENTQGQI